MKFRLAHPWAIRPERRIVDIEAARERERLYRENFQYLRAARQPEFCSSWVLGQRVGWRLQSPVDVTLSPLPQTEVSADDAQAAATAVGRQEMWQRNGSMLAVDRPPWLLQDLGVLVGVLTHVSITRMQATGFSIAIRPQAEVDIRNGQEIARIVLVGPESLKDR